MAHQKFKVFVDMDGVLAAFFEEWARLDGKDHYKDIDNPEAKLDLVRQHPTFWVNLPLLPHARELIRLIVKEFGSYYICSTPLTGDPRSEPGKLAWVNIHLSDMPPKRVILTHNKAEYATANGNPCILVDDYGKNIASWRSAGGIGIKYDDSEYPRVARELHNFAKLGRY